MQGETNKQISSCFQRRALVYAIFETEDGSINIEDDDLVVKKIIAKSFTDLRDLPLREIDPERDQIAAFIIVPEASTDPSNNPLRTILMERYKGIPVFNYSNESNSTVGNTWVVGPGEKVTDKLNSALRQLYRGLSANTYPGQVKHTEGDCVHCKLIAQAGKAGLPEEILWRVIAHVFSDGAQVNIDIVMGDGLSGAVVFAAKSETSIPVLIKIAPWLSAVREFQGAQYVISPKLKIYAATNVSPGTRAGPLLFEESDENRSKRWGAIAYNMVGRPGKSLTKPISLRDKLEELRDKPESAPKLLKQVEETMNHVVGSLHAGARKEKMTLWNWLGEYLPPIVEGHIALPERNDTSSEDTAPKLKSDASAIYHEAKWLQALGNAEKGKKIFADSYLLTQVEGRMIHLRHPQLGFRITAKAENDVDLPLQDRQGFPVRLYLSDVKRVPVGKRWKLETLHPDALLHIFLPELKGATATRPLSMMFEGHQGAIHGDLNLNNILYLPEENIGWLIDFEWCRSAGMIAYDYAKLEIELFQHFLLPEMLALERVFPNKLGGKVLWKSTVAALDEFRASVPLSEALTARLLDRGIALELISSKSFAYFRNLLDVLGIFRQSARKTLADNMPVVPSDLALALGAYAFIASKFAVKRSRFDVAKDLLELSGHYLKMSHPLYLSNAQHTTGKCAESSERQTNTDLLNEKTNLSDISQIDLNGHCARVNVSPESIMAIDRAVLDLLNREGFVESVSKIAGPKSEHLNWGENVEVWDFASTGSVGNITPIVGYLWLMAKRKHEDGKKKIYVPKISSDGSSCGTVDILQAGGYVFTDDVDLIKQRVMQEGGLFCRQDPNLVLVDKVTMYRRRRRNFMKHPKLVMASILAKKLVMGCTNAVIDIKVGRDTKFLMEDIELVSPLLFLGEQRSSLLPDLDHQIEKVLEKYAIKSAETEGAAFLPKYSFIVTNSDQPQCRAIGRKLILIQLEQMFEKDDLKNLNEYNELYFKVIPKKIKVPTSGGIEEQWRALKTKLPYLNTMNPVLEAMRKMVKSPVTGEMEIGKNLKSMTVAWPNGSGVIEKIDAYELDCWFESLCDKGIEHDPDVGFWLHKLPGEVIDENEPFMTIYYHPDEQTDSGSVGKKLNDFLRDHCTWQSADAHSWLVDSECAS